MLQILNLGHGALDVGIQLGRLSALSLPLHAPHKACKGTGQPIFSIWAALVSVKVSLITFELLYH